jgi:hypothetical protein
VRVCALVVDLMERSKINAALGDVEFARSVDACLGADVVIIDLARFHDVAALRAAAPAARLVGFGPHVDEHNAAAAAAAGVDVVLPRSRFFRDPGAAIRAGADP